MHLTASDHLETLIASAAGTNREFIAFLRSYDGSTGQATISTGRSPLSIPVAITPRLRSFPQLMVPNARVLVQKPPGHPLVITDVIDLARARAQAQILPGPHQFIGELFTLRLSGFAAGEPLEFAALDGSTRPFTLHREVFTLTTGPDGAAVLRFRPSNGIVLFPGWEGPITLAITGAQSGLVASVTFQAELPPQF